MCFLLGERSGLNGYVMSNLSLEGTWISLCTKMINCIFLDKFDWTMIDYAPFDCFPLIKKIDLVMKFSNPMAWRQWEAHWPPSLQLVLANSWSGSISPIVRGVTTMTPASAIVLALEATPFRGHPRCHGFACWLWPPTMSKRDYKLKRPSLTIST